MVLRSGGLAVAQYDFGVIAVDGFESTTRSLPKPPALLLTVVNKVEDKFMYLQDGDDDILKSHIDGFSKNPRLRRAY